MMATLTSGRRARWCAALAVPAVLLAASVAGAATVTIKGAGGDSADPLIGKWQQAVAKPPLSQPVDYSADGSGAGRKEFVAGNADFAVTSVPFTTAEDATLSAAGKPYSYVPFTGGSLAFLYHLYNAQGQSISGLQLSGPTLTKIFTGVITNWNDPEILADNPGVSLPAKKIIPTVRGQASGATYTATSYFRYSNPAVWKAFMEDPQRNYPDEARELFPFFAGVDSRTSSFAVADVVRAAEGSDGRIAYVDQAWALGALTDGAAIMKIKNSAGSYVAPTPANTAKTIAAWSIDSKNLLTADFGVTDPEAYPIPMVNYLVVRTSGLAPDVAAGLRTFAHYGLTDGQATAPSVGDPALPSTVLVKSLAALEVAIPPTTTTTTTSSTTLPFGGGTDVLANSTTNGDQLAFTGGVDPTPLLAASGVMLGVGVWLRRRRVP